MCFSVPLQNQNLSASGRVITESTCALEKRIGESSSEQGTIPEFLVRSLIGVSMSYRMMQMLSFIISKAPNVSMHTIFRKCHTHT